MLYLNFSRSLSGLPSSFDCKPSFTLLMRFSTCMGVYISILLSSISFCWAAWALEFDAILLLSFRFFKWFSFPIDLGLLMNYSNTSSYCSSLIFFSYCSYGSSLTMLISSFWFMYILAWGAAFLFWEYLPGLGMMF